VAVQAALDRELLRRERPGYNPQSTIEVGLQPLPRPQFTENFASQAWWLRSIFSIYMVLAMNSPLRWMVTFILEEKEKRIKEGMLMMGLHKSVSRAFPSWNRSILTDIYLCHA
jgi:hypothetical protein